MNQRLKNLAPLLTAVAIAAVVLLPLLTHAQAITPPPSQPAAPTVVTLKKSFLACTLTNPLSWPACFAWAVGTIVATVLGAFLVVLSWVLEVILDVNQAVTTAPSVQVGFAVTLGLANLGFVFGIVVIAIATIIRYQTYGMKQILWKLVVMAILINFSMTIAGTILGFANDFTRYFMQLATPTGLAGGFGGFVKSFVSGLSPQKAIGFGFFSSGGGEDLLSDPGAVIGIIASLYISVLLIAVTVIVMGAAALMLLIRYIALGILLILMPLAWLCWVFPDLQSNWSKWWHTFLRWTFFAPVLMFFIYLSLAAWTKRAEWIDSQRLRTNEQSAAQAIDSANTGVLGALHKFFEKLTDDVAQQVLIVGLMVGGLVAANSLGIMGAGAAMGMATGVANGFKTYAGRKGLGLVSRPSRGLGEGIQKAATRLSGGNVFQRGLGRLLGAAARPAVRLGGMGGEELVKQYEKEHGGRSISDLKNLASIVGGAERIAVQKLLASKGEFNLPQTHSAANQRLWKANNMAQAYKKEIELPSMISSEMYEETRRVAPQLEPLFDGRELIRQERESLEKQLASAKEEEKEGILKQIVEADEKLGDIDEKIDGASVKLKAAADKLFAGAMKADAGKMNVNDVFTNDEKGKMGASRGFLRVARHGTAYGITAAAPHVIATTLGKTRAAEQRNLGAEVKTAVKRAPLNIERLRTAGHYTQEDTDRAKEYAERTGKVIDKLIVNNVYTSAEKEEKEKEKKEQEEEKKT